MKKRAVLISLLMLFASSAVFADAIGPEFPSTYHYHTTEIAPIVFVIIAVIIVALACTASILTNKKKNIDKVVSTAKNQEEDK